MEPTFEAVGKPDLSCTCTVMQHTHCSKHESTSRVKQSTGVRDFRHQEC